MKWNDGKVKMLLSAASKKATMEAAEELLRESNKMVPHDEGTLMRSGEVDVKEGEATVSYDTPYAVRLHEHPEYNFQKGRQGKYLEKALDNNRDRLIKHIQKAIKEAF